jgi:hypothetical protein
MRTDVFLEPWTDADLDIELRANTPEMTRFLGGPEPEEAIRARHARSLALAVNGTGQMFRIASSGGSGVGSVDVEYPKGHSHPLVRLALGLTNPDRPGSDVEHCGRRVSTIARSGPRDVGQRQCSH